MTVDTAWDQFLWKVSETHSSFWSWVNDHLGGWAADHLANIIVILIAAAIVRRFGSKLVVGFIVSASRRSEAYHSETDRAKRVRTLKNLIYTIFNVGTWVIAVLLIISEIRPAYAGVLFASAGVLGVALGFGAQSLIKDFVSGIFIIVENQYRVGDVVTLDKVSGTVEAITIRTTVLRDVDGSVHHVPNGTITVTTNKTMDYGRLNELIALGGEADVEVFEKLVNQIGKQLAKEKQFAGKLPEPPRFDRVHGINDKGDVVVRVTAKTTPSGQLKLRSEFYKRLRTAASKENIKIYA